MSLFVSTLYCPLRSGLAWARRIVWWSISTAYRAYYLAHDAKRIRHFLIDIYILAGRVIIFWPCIRSCWSAEVHRNVHALSLPSIGIKWRWKLMMGVMVTYTSDKMENNSSCIAQKWRSNDLLTQTRNAPIYTPWVAKGIVKIKKFQLEYITKVAQNRTALEASNTIFLLPIQKWICLLSIQYLQAFFSFSFLAMSAE